MSDVQLFEGIELRRFEGEPRVLDVEVASRAGLSQPRNVRQLIESNREELELYGEIQVCTSRVQTSGGRPGIEYWLNEGQTLAVIALMRTKVARTVRFACIKAFMAYRHGETKAVAIHPELVNGPRMGDSDQLRQEMSAACRLAAAGSGYSVRKIQGEVRKLHRISSPYYLALIFWPSVREMLVRIGLKEVVLPGKAKRVLALVRHIDGRQSTLPGVS